MIVPTEVYEAAGIVSRHLLHRIVAVDEICAGKLGLVRWGLAEAAYYVLKSVGYIDDGCAITVRVEVLGGIERPRSS